MSETTANKKTGVWPKSGAIYMETFAVIITAIFVLFLQYGSIDYTVLFSFHSVFTIAGSLGVWFLNKYTLEGILQSRIDSNKITQYLPFELMMASFIVTTTIYVFVYLILSYVNKMSFELPNFLRGLAITFGLSFLMVFLYLSSQVWKSWWSDGSFLFQAKDKVRAKESKDFITINNSRGTVNFDLQNILYFISESKIVFLVDTAGKKWITQYNLSELENILSGRFFRLNRKILVSRQVISQIKKLPNHRLLVTIGQPKGSHFETISRYKSTRFKQWFHSLQQ